MNIQLTLKKKISNKNQIKGLNYEVQIKDYIINNLNKIAYLWKDIPEILLIKYGFIGSHNEERLNRKELNENPLQDTGIDILQIDSDEECILIQCKNGYKNGITMSDLAGYYAWTSSLDNYKGIVYYTSKLSHNIKKLPYNKRLEYIKKSYIDSSENIIIEDSIIPHYYQFDAKNNAIEYFKNNKRGILTMPCGTGKH